MFAFAIWDNDLSRLFLVRDRLGVKPLAFYQNGEEFAFASTVRALKQACYPLELDKEGLLEYLEFGFITDQRSIYKGIRKVAAGSIVEWHKGSCSERIYWTPPQIGSQTASFEEAIEQTEELFLTAVRKRLVADVPVGALLSGGIDSSLVCWAISELGNNVTAFTIGTPDESFDESGVARHTAKHLGIDHEILSLSSSFLPDPTMLAKAYSEPFACSSALGMLAISERISDSATVLLTGDGGDDVFWATPNISTFICLKHGEISARAECKHLESVRNVLPNSGTMKRFRSFVDFSTGGLGAVSQARDGLPFYIHNELLTPLLTSIKFEHREIDWSKSSANNLLDEFLVYDRRTRFVGEYLPKVDGATMYHALESRSPFLDIDLWGYAASLPYSIRLKSGQQKAVLRRIAEKRLGKSLAGQKKQGFLVPAQKWLANEWKNDFLECILNSRLANLGLLNAEQTIESFLKASENGRSVPRQYWFIYVLELWLREEKLGE